MSPRNSTRGRTQRCGSGKSGSNPSETAGEGCSDEHVESVPKWTAIESRSSSASKSGIDSPSTSRAASDPDSRLHAPAAWLARPGAVPRRCSTASTGQDFLRGLDRASSCRVATGPPGTSPSWTAEVSLRRPRRELSCPRVHEPSRRRGLNGSTPRARSGAYCRRPIHRASSRVRARLPTRSRPDSASPCAPSCAPTPRGGPSP